MKKHKLKKRTDHSELISSSGKNKKWQELMSESIITLREKAKITQSELADLLGVHAITISKWERGKLLPGSFYHALMDMMWDALHNNPEICVYANRLNKSFGIGRALFAISSAAYGAPTVFVINEKTDFRIPLAKCGTDEPEKTDDENSAAGKVGKRKSSTQRGT